MQALILPAATELQTQVSGTPDPKVVCASLQQITAVLQNVKIQPDLLQGKPHPALAIYTSLWPILDMCFSRLSNESESAVEEVCRVCKYTIKATRHEFIPHLESLITRMISCYKAKPRCSYLDVCAVSLVELHQDPALHGPFITILQTFSEGTFAVLQQMDDYTSNPDLVDDYFEYVKRYIQRIPGPFIQVPFIVDIVQGAVKGMCIDHHEASRAILSFLTQFIELGSRAETEALCKPVVIGVLEKIGGALMHQLFTATMGAVPIRRLPRIGALMKRMFDVDPASSQAWLQQVLGSIEFIPGHEREKCCNGLLGAVQISGDQGDDKFGDILEDFARVCRVSTRQSKIT